MVLIPSQQLPAQLDIYLFIFFYHQWLVCCVWWRGGGGAWESVCERDEGVFTVVPALLRMSPAIVVLMQHLPAVNKRQCHDSFASNHWSSAPNSSGSPALSYFKSLVPSQVSSMKMRNLLFGVILSLFAVVHSTPLTSKWTSFYVYNIHIFFFPILTNTSCLLWVSVWGYWPCDVFLKLWNWDKNPGRFFFYFYPDVRYSLPFD